MGTNFRHGAGRISLDFIRTLRYRGTPEAVEELADPVALAAWVTQFGSVGAAAASTQQVALGRALREAVNEMIASARGPEGPSACDANARELINTSAAHAVPAPTMDEAARLHWRADDPVLATLSVVARDALDLATSPLLERVRGCANPDCGALFLDTSRPGQRRWCSMSTCGNLAKKNALRLRADHGSPGAAGAERGHRAKSGSAP